MSQFPQAPLVHSQIPQVCCHMSLKDYCNREQRTAPIHESVDPSFRKTILDILRLHPLLWEGNPPTNKEKWANFGIDIYQRTKIVVSIESLRAIFHKAKKDIHGMMKKSIKKLGHSPAETNEFLKNWEYYPNFDYYRNELERYEDKLRQELQQEEKNKKEKEEKKKKEMEKRQKEEIITIDDSEDEEAQDSGKKKKRPVEPYYDENSARHIGEQAARLFAQYPEKANLMRKAFFATIMAFDDDEADYKNLEDLFSKLAVQNSSKKAKLW